MRGFSRLSVENMLSHSNERRRRGNFQCFTTLWYQKLLGINRENFWQGSDLNPEPAA